MTFINDIPFIAGCKTMSEPQTTILYTPINPLNYPTIPQRPPYPIPPPTPPRPLTISGRPSRWGDWSTIPHDNAQSRRCVAEMLAATAPPRKRQLFALQQLEGRALARKVRELERFQRKISLWAIWLDLVDGNVEQLAAARADARRRRRVERLEALVGMKVETFMVTCLEEQADNEALDADGLRDWIEEGGSSVLNGVPLGGTSRTCCSLL